MERAAVARWMEAYREAWVTNDPARVAALFTADAAYRPHPFSAPWAGRDEIVRRWTSGISQQVELDYDVVAVDGDVAVIHWHVFTQNAADPVRTEYDGVVEVTFDGGNRCRAYREWFAQRELR